MVIPRSVCSADCGRGSEPARSSCRPVLHSVLSQQLLYWMLHPGGVTYFPDHSWPTWAHPPFRIWELTVEEGGGWGGMGWGVIHTMPRRGNPGLVCGDGGAAASREPWVAVSEGSTPRLYYHSKLPVQVPTRRRRGGHQPTVVISEMVSPTYTRITEI